MDGVEATGADGVGGISDAVCVCNSVFTVPSAGEGACAEVATVDNPTAASVATTTGSVDASTPDTIISAFSLSIFSTITSFSSSERGDESKQSDIRVNSV